jgi:hypothetical protein
MDPELLADTTKPSNVWKAFFATQSERKDQSSTVESRSDTSWEDLESPSLDKLSAVTSSYVTPKKLKVGFLLEAFADSIPIGLGRAESLTKIPDMTSFSSSELKTEKEKAIQVVLQEWNTLRGNFDTFNDEFSKLGEGEKRYRDAISETVFKIHDAIRDTDARTSLIAAHIGHDQTEASGMGSDSVWNSIRRIYDTLKTIEAEIEKATERTEVMDEARVIIVGKMETLDKNFHGLKTFAQENLSKIAHKIREFENKRTPGNAGVSNSLEYKRLLDRMGIVDEIMERHTKDISKGNRNVLRLDAEFTNLKRKFDLMDAPATYGHLGSTESTSDLRDRVRMLENHALQTSSNDIHEDKYEVLDHEVSRLSNRMDKVEAKGSEESFEMEGFTYSSYSDFTSTVLSDKIPSCGMFWDLFYNMRTSKKRRKKQSRVIPAGDSHVNQ